jgi:hypothetical protein
MAEGPRNPNDLVRRQMLQYFYDRNSNATSQRGKKGAAVKISDVKADLKRLHGLTQQQVVGNLTYLLDRGWVKAIEESKSFTAARGTTIPSTTTYYQVTAQGIERIEGESEFQPRDRYAGIRIEATGESVVTVGDGNVVNVRNQTLFQQLHDLKERIIESDAVSEETKLDIAIDIETLMTQLAKHDPDRQVVQRLWDRIGKVADVASLAGLVAMIEPGIRQLLSG